MRHDHPFEAFDFRFSRNPSYLASLKTAFSLVFLWAPTSADKALRKPFLNFVKSTTVLVFILAAWLFLRVLFLIAGICGYLERTDAGEK